MEGKHVSAEPNAYAQIAQLLFAKAARSTATVYIENYCKLKRLVRFERKLPGLVSP